MKYLNRMLTSRDPRARHIAEKLIAKRDLRFASVQSQIEHLQARFKL